MIYNLPWSSKYPPACTQGAAKIYSGTFGRWVISDIYIVVLCFKFFMVSLCNVQNIRQRKANKGGPVYT